MSTCSAKGKKWAMVMHVCIMNCVIIGWYHALKPGSTCFLINWFSFGPSGPNFTDIVICIWNKMSFVPSSVWYLSHPSVGWLYVFSSFLPRPHPPRPPPQKLFPLTSKPFDLNLWYLAQRIYGSGEMYWMTFPWPWPKVLAVASISKNLLVCAIK